MWDISCATSVSIIRLIILKENRLKAEKGEKKIKRKESQSEKAKNEKRCYKKDAIYILK